VLKYRNALFPPGAALGGSSGNTGLVWTWQQAWEHCRNALPFMVLVDPNYTISSNALTAAELYISSVLSNKISVHKLRAEGARFNPQRAVADWEDLWNLRFLTRLEERMTQ
jgi:hypothetical protein